MQTKLLGLAPPGSPRGLARKTNSPGEPEKSASARNSLQPMLGTYS